MLNSATRKWKKLSSLPYSSTYIHGVTCSEGIVLGGVDLKGIYLYKISNDSYEKLLETNDRSVILKGKNGMIYCLSNQTIYCMSNIREWNIVGNYSIETCMPFNTPIEIDGSIYYSFDGPILKFDYRSLTYEYIGDLTYIV